MYLTDSEISDRFGGRRPGLELIAVEDAALPVTVLEAQVLAQEEKGIPLLDEFVLRSADHGILGVAEIAGFLGFESKVLDSAVASQLGAGNVTYNPDSRRVSLTARGSVAARDLTSLVPVEQEIPITFDRTTWRVADYQDGDLISKRRVQEKGMVILPAARSSRILVSDVRPRDVEDIVSPTRDKRRFQVLEIAHLRARKHLYLPIKLLVFSDGRTSTPEVIVLVDGEESAFHLNQLTTLGGVGKLGLSVLPTQEATPTKNKAERTVREITADLAKIGEASFEIASPVITQVSVFDHPVHLKFALSSAKKRILIISPWIRGSVVDTSFLADLERRLRAGVRVSIGHGYGPDDSGSDAQALKRLANLRQRFPNLLSFVRLPNTHAKILIYDDAYITTSFNWLSFRGDSNRTYRMEEGTMVEGSAYADEIYARYEGELDKQASSE